MDVLNAGVTPEVYQNLYIGSEREMLWHCRSDPRFHYYAYIPQAAYSANPPTFRILCFVHGTGRTTEEYRRLFADFADRNHLIGLFPMFPGGLMDRDDFNSYKLLAYRGVRYDQILLAMMDELAERFPIDTGKLLLYGWSGGGQFANRFLLVHPERLAAVCIGAPGRPTYLDDTRDFYWGTRDFERYFDKRPDVAAIGRVPATLMVGELDTRFIGDAHCGDNRRQRVEALARNLSDYGVKVDLKIIPGFEHKGDDGTKAGIVMPFFQKVLDAGISG